MDIHPITLSGRFVRLEPLSLNHLSDLCAVGLEDEIWRYMVYGWIRSEQDMRDWIEELLKRQASGSDLPFAVIDLISGKAIGATRYMEIRPKDRGLEIGGTWYGLAYQHTIVNTESKFLLLQYAFENLGCIRVQFKTDSRNTRSQKALERLGAVKEGVLRNHMILPDGTIRHSIYYSIIQEEWQTVKERLLQFLNKAYS
ncbi:MAG: GNAT family N-acetyltransferase [Anaerolineales bacterium]